MDKPMRRVMIACVTFDTVKISDPCEYYGSNVVYLIHYVKEPSPENVYQQFYNRVCELIREKNPSVIINEINCDVTDFNKMLRTVNEIVEIEKGLDCEYTINVNLSAGSAEYTAAASAAAMMNPNMNPFFVRVSKYKVTDEDLRGVYFSEGKPVGLAAEVKDVVPMVDFQIDVPDSVIVRSLRLYKECLSESRVFSSDFIQTLKQNNLWTRISSNSDKLSAEGLALNEKVFFQRRYIDVWKRNGWIEKAGTGYALTPAGETAIYVLYPDVGCNSNEFR